MRYAKVTDFQCHMIEHQVGAYTDCNHGIGLSIIHPALYRHIYQNAPEQFTRMAVEVWGVDPENRTTEKIAIEGINALESFIKKIGMPLHFSEIGITDLDVMRKAADTCILTAGCCKKLDREEVFEILKECM